MRSRMFKIFYAVIIALLTIVLIVFMIIHITKGLAGGNEKLILGGYVLMILWALMKLYNSIRALREE